MGRKLGGVIAACALLCSSLSGCGDDDESGGAGAGFMNEYANVYCSGVAPCCAAAGSEHDVSACKQFFEFYGSVAARSAKHFDAAAADQCLVDLQAALASCDSKEPASCSRALSGDAAPGAACDDDIDCALPPAGTARCDLDFETDTGKCQVLLPPEEGKPCGLGSTESEVYDCTDHPLFYCGSDSLCVARVAIGSPCTSSNDCTADGFCDTTSNVCVAKIAIGQSCASAECVDEAYCDAADSCQQKKAAGQACTEVEECEGWCDSTTSTCKAVGLTLCISSD
jgi:hypothetical protein